MSDIMIRAEHISKRYRLGKINARSFADEMSRMFARIKGKDDPLQRIGMTNDRSKVGANDVVWAVNDVSFDIRKGEVVGILGKNGAGKSALLRILSRITAPTTGVVKLNGRVASLLEVGTGFHPELSGRENVYLNGAIMGMKKREIAEKFDEIIEFSGIGGYIDTPVKRYSSGMYVRLAFAVAAHLEPDILIIDEVLAVGDAEFQKKALGKMQSVSQTDGRTVLFVSHSMSAVQALCSRCLLMENGQLIRDSLPATVVDYYINGGSLESRFGLIPPNHPRMSSYAGVLQLKAIELLDSNDKHTTTFLYHQVIRIRLTVEASKLLDDVIVVFTAGNEMEEYIIYASSCDRRTDKPLTLTAGEHVIELELNQQLQPGSYFSGIMLWDKYNYSYDTIRRFGRFFVEDFGDDDRFYRWNKKYGYCNPDMTTRLLQ